MILSKKHIFLTTLLSLISAGQSTLQNSSNNQARQMLLRESMLKEQIKNSNSSLDNVLNIEDQFDSTNVPIKLLITPTDIEEYYQIKLNRIKDDIMGLEMIQSILDTSFGSRNFGYDYFYNFNQKELWERSIPPEKYILSPGDEIIISIWGQTQRREKKILGRDGAVFIDDIGQVQLGGKNLVDAQTFVEKRLSMVYESISGDNPQTYVDLSHGKISGKTLSFTGNVNSPGFHIVTPYVHPLNSIIYAGGIDTTGSLRNILFYRNDILIDTLDLYDYLIDGLPKNKLFIRDGDRIHVPNRLIKVTISGEVLRPGNFEMENGETLLKAVTFAGGYKKNKNFFIHLQRDNTISGISESESKYLSWSDLGSIICQDGDKITISSFQDQIEYIYVYGFDEKPIKIPYEENMSIKSVINMFGGIKMKNNINKWSSEVSHRYDNIINNISLDDIISGRNDPLLFPNNQITFRKNLNYEIPGTIKISGAVNNAGSLPVSPHGDSLINIIELAGGKRTNALSEGVQIFRDSLRLGWQNESMLILPGDSIVILYDQGTIEILGEVNAPGIYEIGNKSISVNKAIGMSGGININGSRKNIFVIYPNGMVQSASRRFGRTSIKSGSTLIVGSKSPSEYQTTLETTEKLAGIIGSLATLMLVINSTTTN